MKIITEPTVTVFSKPVFIEQDAFEIPDDGNDCIRIGSFAAKGCYDSKGKNGRSNIENQKAVIESQHGSVLEHINIGLYITGITRGLSLELNRHRTFAISQRSTRYTKEEDAALVLEPYYAELYNKWHHWISQCETGGYTTVPGLSSNYVNKNDVNEIFLIVGHLNSAVYAFEQYSNEVFQLETLNPNNLSGFDLRKWARGKARNILPHGLETRGCWTNNIRGWRWVLEARSSVHAEPEIRRLSNRIYDTLMTVAPEYFDDFYISSLQDGLNEYRTKFPKV